MIGSVIVLGAISLLTVTGIVGGGKAYVDSREAKAIIEKAKLVQDSACERQEMAGQKTEKDLKELGEWKLKLAQQPLERFITLFKQVKNVERHSEGIDDLKKFQIDEKSIAQLEKISISAKEIGASVVGGGIVGGVAAAGAYGLAGTIGIASTGAAISGLSGAAASSATLAWLGGGALAAGGGGVALGTAVLGGIVVAPAVFLVGGYAYLKSAEKLDDAKAQAEKVNKYAAEVDVVVQRCTALSNLANLYTGIIKKLYNLVEKNNNALADVIKREGNDYRLYSQEAKETFAVALVTAQATNAMLNTSLLDKVNSDNLNKEAYSVARIVRVKLGL